jgi:hypothetical protein
MRQAATAEPSTDTVSHKSRPQNGVVSFTRMGGSSIAALDAATWVTAAGTDKGRPIFTRGYVTITKLVTPADPAGLGVWFAALEAGLARFGDSEPHALPDGAQPLVGLDLTTHAGHFMGAGHNRLLLFTHEGKAFVRAAGTWDPMPWHIQHAYRIAGRDAQHAFWGQGNVVAQSMLHQLALRTAGAATPV